MDTKSLRSEYPYSPGLVGYTVLASLQKLEKVKQVQKSKKSKSPKIQEKCEPVANWFDCREALATCRAADCLLDAVGAN
jgi:hypothetical protein